VGQQERLSGPFDDGIAGFPREKRPVTAPIRCILPCFPKVSEVLLEPVSIPSGERMAQEAWVVHQVDGQPVQARLKMPRLFHALQNGDRVSVLYAADNPEDVRPDRFWLRYLLPSTLVLILCLASGGGPRRRPTGKRKLTPLLSWACKVQAPALTKRSRKPSPGKAMLSSFAGVSATAFCIMRNLSQPS
jgi:hypothetical protein